jgi:hypothetical protein
VSSPARRILGLAIVLLASLPGHGAAQEQVSLDLSTRPPVLHLVDTLVLEPKAEVTPKRPGEPGAGALNLYLVAVAPDGSAYAVVDEGRGILLVHDGARLIPGALQRFSGSAELSPAGVELLKAVIAPEMARGD